MGNNIDKKDTVLWLTSSGVLYLFLSLILNRDIYSSFFLIIVFFIDAMAGIYLIFKLKLYGLTHMDYIYLFFFSGLGFTATFTVYIASYPKPMIGLGWVIFLTIILKIITDTFKISVEIEVSE